MPTSKAKACRQKTARGSVFDSYYAADAVAIKQRKKEPRIVAYHCRVCGKYHIGKTGHIGQPTNGRIPYEGVSMAATPATPPKGQSLAAAAGLTANQLPAMFEAPTMDVKKRTLPPYVTFAHPMSPLWTKIIAKYPALQEGEQYLVEGETYTKLNPFKYVLMMAKQYWAKGDKTGLTAASMTEKQFPFKEQIETVIIVFLPDRLVPATCGFRSTKCGAVHPMVEALAEAATPAWAEKSPAHKLTLTCEKPFMRFFGTVVLGNQKTSKSSGNPYIPGNVQVSPTTAVEWKQMAEYFVGDSMQVKDFYADLNGIAETFTRRMEDVVTLSKKP